MANSNVLKIAATELKNRMGQALRAAEHGRRVVVTRRGRPVAVIIPATAPPADEQQVPYDQAWQDIEQALADSEPRHRSWRDAFGASRRRV